MAERNRPHIFVNTPALSEPYTPPARNITPRPFAGPPDRTGHGARLRDELGSAHSQGLARRAATAAVDGSLGGIYVSFESFPGVELAIESLDPRQGRIHPELRALRTFATTDGQSIERATVFIPDGKLGYFLARLQKYFESAQAESPFHSKLFDKIQSIALTSIEQLWTDRPENFPDADTETWWEVWLRRRDGHEVERLQSFASAKGIAVGSRVLSFHDRLVVIVRASGIQLAGALDVLDDLAELRAPRQLAQVLARESALEQRDWVDQLVVRTTGPSAQSAAVCILDTGVSHEHPLLAHSLSAADCHACVPSWQPHDHHGHGTAMAGIALYGDLVDAILSEFQVVLRHRLESVKLLPPSGANPPELYGALTATGASLVEIQAPNRRRLFSMSITASSLAAPGVEPDRADHGRPTSWSASIDALAAGLGVDASADGIVLLNEEEPGEHRLFVISAGNVREFEEDHLGRSDLEPVEDPGQAWNALTVGAMTNLDTLDPADEQWRDWTPLAPRGELSPFSRTSLMFGRNWPPKPEVVFEGGNAARSPGGTEFDWPEALQLLTTRRLLDGHLLDLTCMTSAATAGVAFIGGEILAEYPSLWPETVRALIVHSAEWTPAMLARFGNADTKRKRSALRARYGMGVPDLERATRSAVDALTVIVQDSIHPFDGEGRMGEMHLHALPWPADVLSSMAEARVRLRVTLSYFIEPNPSRRGWRQRFRYASHGLRFEVRRPTETVDEFRKRINKLARDEGVRHESSDSDAEEWFFGPDSRAVGSLHADNWTGTAAELAERGYVAVYPVSGWWKDGGTRDHSYRGAPYSLVVSIESPEEEVDLWTPVANQVGIPIEIQFD